MKYFMLKFAISGMDGIILNSQPRQNYTDDILIKNLDLFAFKVNGFIEIRHLKWWTFFNTKLFYPL